MLNDSVYSASAAPQDSNRFLRWLGFFMRPYAVQFAIIFFFQLCRSTFFVMTPFFISVLLSLYEKGQETGDFSKIWMYLKIYAVFLFVACISIYISQIFTYFRDRVTRHLSVFSLKHLTLLPVVWHETNVSGNQMQKIIRGRDGFDLILRQFYFSGIPFIAAFVGTGLAVSASDAPLFYMFLYFGLLTSYSVTTIAFVFILHKRIDFYQAGVENTIGKVYEFMNSMQTVKLFNLRNYIGDQAGHYEYDNHKRFMRFTKMNYIKWAALNTIGGFWLLLIAYNAISDLVAGEISVAVFSFLAFMTYTLWFRAEEFTIIIDEFIPNHSAFMRLVANLRQKPTIKNKLDAAAIGVEKGEIVFDGVGFSYHKKAQVFDDLSIRIKPGQKVGLVGHSGAGKTTLIKLLVRFYDVTAGAIKIDGQDIRDIDLYSLKQNIAVIPQDISMFNHPIIENIRYGKLDALDDEVIEAAIKAHADEFIQTLPEGYATLVGERGVKLSGGQRQRVAIARAILKDAPILILDEATSALDSESEKLIQESLKKLMEGKTVLAVAHRLSTISNMDRILVFDNGKIVEDGTHEELLAQDGHYARLWAMQSGGFLKGGE